MISYTDFCAKWNGKQVMAFGSECVALIAEYESENGLPIVWGDAHQWANNPTMASAYDWVQNNPTDPNQLPPQGAIIIWPMPNEHIAFYDHNLGNHQFMSFGQNSGGPQAHFQPHSWEHVVGWWVPKQAAPPPAPYHIEGIAPVQIHVQPNRYKWNLAQPDFNAVVANPITSSGSGLDFTAVAKLTRDGEGFAGYSYYLEDANTPHGWNALDCTVVQQQPMPKPYVAPTGAVNVPTNTDPYHLVIDVPGYSSATDAANHVNKKVTVPNGQYMKFTEKYGMINVTQVQGKPGSWINPADNVIPPPPPPPPKPESTKYLGPREPTPPEVVPVEVKPLLPEADTSWKATFTSYYPNSRKPIRYVFLRDYHVTDLADSGSPMDCKQYSEISLYGTFLKDGVEYGRPKRRDDQYFKFFYGVPMTKADGSDAGVVEPEQKVYDPSTTTADREALSKKSHHNYLTPHDYQTLAFARIERLIDGIVARKPRKK